MSNYIQILLIAPFFMLLSMIATGPLLYPRFWHRNYTKISIGFATFISFSYFHIEGNFVHSVHAFAEYIQFISLIGALYIVSGGIYINVNTKSSALKNVVFLLFGALLANFIGTTGASVLLIKPFINLNKHKIKAYHIVFFIFMVSNIGGVLTPIGDPPLFLGFLKGVPFYWPILHTILPWCTTLALLSIVFYIKDRKNNKTIINKSSFSNISLEIRGKKSIFVLGGIICCIFIDPNIWSFIPSISFHGYSFSFIRELIMISIAFFSYRFGNKTNLDLNKFSFEPIREIGFLFFGIFFTLIPLVETVASLAQEPKVVNLLTNTNLYWLTGFLSSFLDNAPTYLNFLNASMSAKGLSINNIEDVKFFATSSTTSLNLKAISISSVFFGAMTYIGNGPNMLVKAVAEDYKIRMPSFFRYLLRYSLTILCPILVFIWILYVR